MNYTVQNRASGVVVYAYTSDEAVAWPEYPFAEFNHIPQLGTGTGPGQTIFASRFSVVTGEDRFTVVRKAKRQAPKPEAVPRRGQQPKAPNDKALFAVARTQGVATTTQEDRLTIIQKTQCLVATTDLGNLTVNRKAKKS